MNELLVSYGKNWLYFKTGQFTADKAYQEYEEMCENAGINIDNMKPVLIVLRDKDQNDIDRLNV